MLGARTQHGGGAGAALCLHTFAINAARLAARGLDEATYIQGAFLDSARLGRARLFHRELFAHANLTLVMDNGQEPQHAWGSDHLPRMTMAVD